MMLMSRETARAGGTHERMIAGTRIETPWPALFFFAGTRFFPAPGKTELLGKAQ
jgi:hypothetical protein